MFLFYIMQILYLELLGEITSNKRVAVSKAVEIIFRKFQLVKGRLFRNKQVFDKALVRMHQFDYNQNHIFVGLLSKELHQNKATGLLEYWKHLKQSILDYALY